MVQQELDNKGRLRERTSEHEEFSILQAKGMKVLVKMSRICIALKTGLILLFSYSDLITDMFVLWSYWMVAKEGAGLRGGIFY